MCVGGSGSSMPAPAAPAAAAPPPPTMVDPAVLAARQNMINQAAQARGRASTIVDQTGAQGQEQNKTLTGQ